MGGGGEKGDISKYAGAVFTQSCFDPNFCIRMSTLDVEEANDMIMGGMCSVLKFPFVSAKFRLRQVQKNDKKQQKMENFAKNTFLFQSVDELVVLGV